MRGAAAIRVAAVAAFALLLAAAAPQAAPDHILTFGSIGAEHARRAPANYEFGVGVSYAQAAKWVTWAATDDRYAAAIHAAGIKTAMYVDPHRISANGFPMDHATPSDEKAYFHNCDGSRVRTSYDGKLTQDVGDPGSPALAAFFNGYIDAHQHKTANAYDAVWEDDAGPLSEFYQPFTQPLPGCWYPGDERYDTEQRAFDAHAHLPVIYENLANHHGGTESKSVALVGAPNVIAGLLEFCFANGYGGNDPRAKESGEIWTVEENTVLDVLAEHRMLLCFDYPSSAATPQAYDQRGYILASLLLTFDPERSVLAEQVETPSGVPVEPEAALVPLDPLVAQPRTIDGLRTATGVYGREYRACYVRGKPIGACAIAVNPNPLLPLPFPWHGAYTRTLQISGRGVVDGVDDGRVTFGGPPPLLVASRGWVIVAR